MNYKQQRESLKRRQSENVKNKGRNSRSNKGILDFSDYEEINFFKPTRDKLNMIDIIPWIVATTNHPQGLEKGSLDYILDVHIHFKVGPGERNFICLKYTFGKKCPICEEYVTKKEEGESKEVLERYKPSRRAIYNIIDKNEEEKGIQLFEASYAYFEKELNEEIQVQFDQEGKEAPTIVDLDEGMTVQFRAAKDKYMGHEFNKYKSFNFLEREPYPQDILDDVYPLDKLLVIPTYDEVRDAFLGLDEEDSEKSEEKEEKSVEEEETDEIDRKAEKKRKSRENREEKKDDNPPWKKSKTKKEEKIEDHREEWKDLVKSLEGKNKREIRKFIKENNLEVTISPKMTEEEMIEEIVKTISDVGKKEEKAGEDDRCPNGHRFGYDCDETEDCANDCSEYFDCIDANEALEKE